MSRKKSGVNYSKTAPATSRRERALALLEAQLKSGVKTIKIEGKDTTLPLEEKDNLRIKKEMANIKVKI
jgi:hypothetical protein